MRKLSLLLVVILISCTQSKVEKQNLIDITKISGKSIIEVEKVLGKADKIEPFTEGNTPCKNIPCQKAYYQKEKYEIVFINEKADWITINGLSNYDFSEDNIEIIGLPKTTPEFKNPESVIRWKNIGNINEINIFNDGSNKISYIYIKVLTE